MRGQGPRRPPQRAGPSSSFRVACRPSTIFSCSMPAKVKGNWLECIAFPSHVLQLQLGMHCLSFSCAPAAALHVYHLMCSSLSSPRVSCPPAAALTPRNASPMPPLGPRACSGRWCEPRRQCLTLCVCCIGTVNVPALPGPDRATPPLK
jgi:hypothetical protein